MRQVLLMGILLVFATGLGACEKLFPSKNKPSKLVEAVTPPQQPTVNIAANYGVTGTNPGGKGRYRGTATISPAGDQYKVHWEVGAVYDGVGKLDGKVFTVKWGPGGQVKGEVTYTLSPEGNMQGTWYTYDNPKILGTETLIPR